MYPLQRETCIPNTLSGWAYIFSHCFIDIKLNFVISFANEFDFISYCLIIARGLWRVDWGDIKLQFFQLGRSSIALHSVAADAGE